MSRRIDTRSSQTAEWTTLCRAVSYMETRKEFKSEDWIAPRVLPRFVRMIIMSAPIRRVVTTTVMPRGMYEYVIARTRYIDDAFQQALQDGFSQIFIMGAGFDSRSIRFSGRASKTRVFELDAPHTQRAKLDQYRRERITFPSNLVLIPIDFERQTLAQRLAETGFQKGEKSMFILEGLTMYLERQSIDETFRVISDYAGPGSRVIFDYVLACMLRREGLDYGEKEILSAVTRAGETWRFAMDKDEVEPFAKRYGLRIIDQLCAEDLENRYFRTAGGTRVARVNGSHCIVTTDKC